MEGLHFRLAESGDAASVLAVKRAAIRDLASEADTDEHIDAWAPDEDALGAFEAAVDPEQFTVLLAVASLNATDFYASLGYWRFETLTRSIDGVDVEFAVMRKRVQ
jgi:hypothetical protein